MPATMPSTPTSVLLGTPLWGRDGGVAAHVTATAALLAERGVRVSVMAPRIDRDERVPGVELHHCPQLFHRDAAIGARLAGALASAPEVVHLHQLDDPAMVAALREHAPVVVSAHAYTACASGLRYFRPGHECERPHGPGCALGLIARNCAHVRDPRPLPASYRTATRGLAALTGADLAIAYSSAVERHLANNGVARRVVVPLFATLAPRDGCGHATRRRVVFAGRIVRPKGLDVLLRAMRVVDDAELVVCGEGFQLNAMRRLARRLGLDRRVTFKGWLAAEPLAQELADASVVAVPSLWPEPFGLVGIEALAAGRPVVASAAGGVRDWLQHAVNGLLVRPGDVGELARALRELLADPARQSTMGAAGRELVAERFSPARHVEALREGYAKARRHWQAEHADGALKPPRRPQPAHP